MFIVVFAIIACLCCCLLFRYLFCLGVCLVAFAFYSSAFAVFKYYVCVQWLVVLFLRVFLRLYYSFVCFFCVRCSCCCCSCGLLCGVVCCCVLLWVVAIVRCSLLLLA